MSFLHTYFCNTSFYVAVKEADIRQHFTKSHNFSIQNTKRFQIIRDKLFIISFILTIEKIYIPMFSTQYYPKLNRLLKKSQKTTSPQKNLKQTQLYI